MKFLTGLVIAQLVLIGLLFLRVIALESSLDTTPGMDTPVSPTAATPVRALPDNRAITLTSHDEDRLRAIIRDELSAIQPAAPTQETTVRAAPSPQDDIEFDYRLEEVRQTLDFYAQTGQIGAADMARLQSDIANLRPGDREAMLRRLVRELNSGAIDGRL